MRSIGVSLAGVALVCGALFSSQLQAEGLDKISPSLYSRLSALFDGPASSPEKDGRHHVRIALYIHPDLPERYSRGWTHVQGKSVENGAQFVVSRFVNQLQRVNALLTEEGFNVTYHLFSVQLAPLRYPDLPDRAHYEFAEFSLCYWGGENSHSHCRQAKEKHGAQQYDALAQGIQQGADIFIYLRDKRSTESRTGLAYPGVGAVILDNYHETVWDRAIRQDDGRFAVPDAEVLEISTLLHELGHVMGVIEHDLDTCEVTPSVMSANQAIASNALSFSPAQATGDCAAQATERARRIDYTIKRLPLNRLSMNAGEVNAEQATVPPRNSGPLTWQSHLDPISKKLVITLEEPSGSSVTISWLAADGTAWEGRDFWFGLQVSDLQGRNDRKNLVLTLPPTIPEVRTLSLRPIAAQGKELSDVPFFTVTLRPNGKHEISESFRGIKSTP